jgi:hypothetical protein
VDPSIARSSSSELRFQEATKCGAVACAIPRNKRRFHLTATFVQYHTQKQASKKAPSQATNTSTCVFKHDM